MKYFCSVPDAIRHIRQGKILILVDHERRENEGDFFLPAQFIDPSKVNFMITHGRGLLCVPMTKSHAMRLGLPLMVSRQNNTEKTGVNFTVSVNATLNIKSGISAFDRAETIRLLADERSGPHDFAQPGHVFPLVAKERGVLEREGHTEAAVDLLQLADLSPTGVLCEIIHKDGTMAKLPDLIRLSKKYDLKILSVSELIAFIKSYPLVKHPYPDVARISEANLPTKYGQFRISVYRSQNDNEEHAVLSKGDISKQPVLTRIHSQCLTGDTFSSLRCDCQEQLNSSMDLINKNGRGILIYLNQEGRGIGLANKIKAYAIQEHKLDTLEANEAFGYPVDAREYKIAAEILQDMGISEINLLTNNPDKIKNLEENGIKVVERIPLETKPHKYNKHYLSTKKNKLGHLLSHD